MKIRRSLFYKLWLFLEVLTIKRAFYKSKRGSNTELYLGRRYGELVEELKSIR